MDKGDLFESLSHALLCGGSHSQRGTTLSSRSDSEPLDHLCATCNVLQKCRTNDIPTTNAERAHINMLVKDARSGINRLDEEIRQGCQTGTELENKRDDLQRLVDLAHSLTAPVRKLPLEIWDEIFQLICLSDGSYSLNVTNPEHLETNESMTQPLDLSQVCALWRDRVLALPALWSALNIVLERVSTQKMAQLVECHLQRSRSQPLRLRILGWQNSPGERSADREVSSHAYGVFEKLLAEYERWHESIFAMTPRATRLSTLILSHFQAPRQVKFPVLTDLNWDWEFATDEEFRGYSNLLSLADFPKLLVCTVDSLSPAHLDSIRMPNLRELNLDHYFEHSPLAVLLHSLPNLHKCQIWRLANEELESQLEHPLVNLVPPHRHLRRLTLSFHQDLSSQALERFFYSLSLPHLESLSLTSHAVHSGTVISNMGLLTMLDRSRISIQHLSLRFFEEQKIVQILDHVSSLTNLSLLTHHTDTSLSSAFYKRLAFTGDDHNHMPTSRNLVPRLKSLETLTYRVESSGTRSWFFRVEEESTLDSLCDMVESRCNFSDIGVSRLESLSLGKGPSSTPLASLPSNHRLRERFQPLVDTGLSLDLIMHPSEQNVSV